MEPEQVLPELAARCRSYARKHYGQLADTDDIEIYDDDPVRPTADNTGYWVPAMLYVRRDDVDEDLNEETEDD